ncbi:hypothetical protein GIB67_036307, partial [Kingdonia uniflora]
DLNAFKSLKVGGAGNSLSLKKLKEHYAYKLEKVLSDGTAVATKKKKGLTGRSVARAYMMYNISRRWESWIFAHFPKLAGIPKEIDSDACKHCTCWEWDVSVTDRYGGTALLKFKEALDNYRLEDRHKHASLSPNSHDTMPTRGRSGGFDQQITTLND